jgi:hypothetical protein
VVQNLHGVNEDGSAPNFSVQVLINSSQQFGPSNLRELSVGIPLNVMPMYAKCPSCTLGLRKVKGAQPARGQLEAGTKEVAERFIIMPATVDTSDCVMQSEHVSQLVMIPGIITAASKPKHAPVSITVMCRDCRLETTMTALPGIGGFSLPRVCTLSGGANGGASKCSLDPWVIMPNKSSFADQQTLKLQVRGASMPPEHAASCRCRSYQPPSLQAPGSMWLLSHSRHTCPLTTPALSPRLARVQERPEDVPTGELPRSMSVVCDRSLVGSVSPGTRVRLVGVYAIHSGKDSGGKENHGTVAIRQPYFRCAALHAFHALCTPGAHACCPCACVGWSCCGRQRGCMHAAWWACSRTRTAAGRRRHSRSQKSRSSRRLRGGPRRSSASLT